MLLHAFSEFAGKIMRLTIPKSQGKQEFYDARKSSWGDIFPHEPKNPPHERFRSKTESIAASIKKGGKGSKSFGPEERAKHKKELKKERRSDRVRVGERLNYDGAMEQIT
jgi:ribosomal protein RSM22 (predicted rRNA methylase)